MSRIFRTARTLDSGTIVLLGVLIVTVATLWLSEPIVQMVRRNTGHDFMLIYAAANALRHLQNPYDPAVLTKFALNAGMVHQFLLDVHGRFNQPYVYPPLFAWLAIPFTFASPALARLEWRIVEAVIMFVGTLGLLSLWTTEKATAFLRLRHQRILLALIITIAPASIYAMYWGNPVVLVYGAMAGWIWAMTRHRPAMDVLAGAFMSVVVLKPQLALPLAMSALFLLTSGPAQWERRKRVFLSFLATCGVLLVLDLITTGPALLLDWPRSILFLSQFTLQEGDIPSLTGIVQGEIALLPHVFQQVIIYGTELGGIIAAIGIYRRQKRYWAPSTVLAVMTAAIFVTTPYGHANDIILLFPVAIALISALYARLRNRLQVAGASDIASVVKVIQPFVLALEFVIATALLVWYGGFSIFTKLPGQYFVPANIAAGVVPLVAVVAIWASWRFLPPVIARPRVPASILNARYRAALDPDTAPTSVPEGLGVSGSRWKREL